MSRDDADILGKRTASPPATLLASGDTADQRCLNCNYDCRGLNRCPECGLVLDDQSLLDKHRLPWTARGDMGRFAAFFRTTYRVLRHPVQLADAAYGKQDDREARRFAWINAWFSAALLFAAIAFGAQDQIRDFAPFSTRNTFWQPVVLLPRSDLDLIVPLMAGYARWTVAGAIALAALLVPFSLPTPFAMIRDSGKLTDRSLRCASLTRFLSAGMSVLSITLALALFRIYAGTERLLPQFPLDVLLCVLLLTLALGIFTLLVSPIILFRKAGGEWWQMVIAGVIYAVQFALILGLTYLLWIHLPGLALTYRQVWQ